MSRSKGFTSRVSALIAMLVLAVSPAWASDVFSYDVAFKHNGVDKPLHVSAWMPDNVPLLGLVFGIWALVVLGRREVIEGFPAVREQRAAFHPQLTRPGTNRVVAAVLWTIGIHGLVLLMFLAFFVIVIPDISPLLEGRPQALISSGTLSLVGLIQRYWLVLFPALLGVDAGMCFLLQYLAGARARRGWSLGVMAVMSILAVLMYSALMFSLGSVADALSHRPAGGDHAPGKSENPSTQSTSLKVSDVMFSPLCEGRNSVGVTVENLSDAQQVFGVYIYARSPHFGAGGDGWGMPFFAKIGRGEKRDLEFAFRIQGPITDDTYVTLSLYNPPSWRAYDCDRFFKRQTYLAKDIKAQQQQAQAKEQQAVLQAFREMQELLAQEKYPEAWDRLSNKYKEVEFQNRGLKTFEGAMKGDLMGKFIWSRQEFLQFKPLSVSPEDRTYRLKAGRDGQVWTLDFIREQDRWMIDWVGGYTPSIVQPSTQPATQPAVGQPSTGPGEVVGPKAPQRDLGRGMSDDRESRTLWEHWGASDGIAALVRRAVSFSRRGHQEGSLYLGRTGAGQRDRRVNRAACS